VLINITGGHDLTLFELDEAANRIREEVDPEANIIVGSTLDENMGGMMRVSVVATGIDAVDVNTEMPVPRRSMSRPLSQEVAEEVVDYAPAAAAATRAPAQAAQAAESPRQEQQAPSFFDDAPQEAARAESTRDMFEGRRNEYAQQAADDVPPPAYAPESASHAPQHEHLEAEPEAFIAPRAPAPGTPSPEAMARLRAAAQRTSPAGQSRAVAQQQYAAQPAQPKVQAPAPQGGERPRFGINSLINRMTGTQEGEGLPRAATAPQPSRQQPPVQRQQTAAAPQPRQDADPEQERIEIPAFLRRQAN
jgi:cell division protein FtsZ